MKNQKTTQKIENVNLSDEQILSMNLDEMNIDKVLSQIPKKEKKTSSKEKMYKIEVTKKDRQKLRKKRNKFISNVIHYAQEINEKDLKNEIKLFNEFYKEFYLKNDYSIESICANNSDEDTKAQIKIFFHILKSKK